MPATRAGLRRVRGVDFLDPSGRLYPGRRRSSTPQPDRRISRLSPALARTFRPGSGTAAKATCQPSCAVHRHSVGLHPFGHRAGPAEPHPPSLRHPDLADVAGHAADVPLLAAPPHDPEPFVPPSLTPRRPPGRVRRVEEGAHRLGEVPQGLLLYRLGALGQPRMGCPRLRELPALFQVARRAVTARPPVRVLLDRQVPHEPGMRAVAAQHSFLGRRGQQAIPRHTNTLATTTDIPEEVKRSFLPGLKARVSTPRSP